MLHRAIALALETLSAGQTDQGMISLARHYLQADLPEKAIPFLLAAGDRARNQNAFQEALEHYQQALNLLRERGELEEAARTMMKIGLTHHNASNFELARLINQEAFRLWQQASQHIINGSLSPAPHPLRIAAENLSGSLDPAMAKESPRKSILQQLFSGLMRMGPNLELLPDLARGWDVLDQGRRYLFHLRQDALWSDGIPVTAGDFVFAWKRVLDPASASPNAIDFFDIRGAHAYHLGEQNFDDIGISALDDFTLQVDLENAYPYFPNLLLNEAAKPVPRHVIERFGSAWTEPDKIVTNGPFRLAGYEQGDRLSLRKNPNYHGTFTGNIEEVQVYLGLGNDRICHLEMYKADKLDVLYSFPHLPPKMQKQLREELVGEYRSSASLATWLIGFVLDQPPFDDRRVRRALAMAINR